MVNESEFIKELTILINRHSLESYSNTPDFLLANYIKTCLDAFAEIVNKRDNWYGNNY